MNSQAPTPPADNRLDYWRHVARSAEKDLHLLRDGIFEAIEDADADRGAGDGGDLILGRLITELQRLANLPADRRQRAQDAYTAVSDRFPELDK